MTSTTLKMLHVANWVLAFFLAFTWLVQWDESSPLPVRASVTVTQWKGGATLPELRHDTASFARAHEITVAQEVVDFHRRYAARNLYMVGGDPSIPASSWKKGHYRDFSRSIGTHFYPFSELGYRTPIGRYDVFSDAAKANELKAFFASQGLSSYVDVITVRSSIPRAVLVALTLMLFFSVVVVGANVLAAVKAYGIGRLQGMPYHSLLLVDLRAGAVVWTASGVVLVAVTSIFAAVYNGMADFGTFVGVGLLVDAFLTVASFAANALVLYLVMRIGIQRSLKGELPGRTSSAMAHVLRISAVLVTAGTMATALHVSRDVVSRERSYDVYARQGDTSAISLGNAYTLTEQAELTDVVGKWLRKQDQAGNILLAGDRRLASRAPLLDGRSVLYVNETFLSDQPIRLVSGENYAANSAGAAVSVLIPSGLWESRKTVEAEIGANALLRDDAGRTKYRTIETAPGQSFFTYSVPSATRGPSGIASNDQANVRDPVVVLLPSSEGLLSDDGYAAFASSGQILFPDPSVVAESIAGHQKLQTYIRAVIPLSEQAAVERQTAVRQLRLALLSAIIGVLVLVVTGIGLVLIHVKRNHQLIFARHLNGWSFRATHRGILAMEVVTVAVLGVILTCQVWRQNRALAAYQAAGEALPERPLSMTANHAAAIILLAAVMMGSVLVALTRGHRRIVHHGAGEV